MQEYVLVEMTRRNNASRSIKETTEFIEAKLKEFCSEMGLTLSITEDYCTDILILHFKGPSLSISKMLNNEDIAYQDSQFINYLLDNIIRDVREKYKEALLKREKEMTEKDMQIKLDRDGLAMPDYRQWAANSIFLEEGWNTSTSNTDSSAKESFTNEYHDRCEPELEPDEDEYARGTPIQYKYSTETGLTPEKPLTLDKLKEAMDVLSGKELSTLDKLRKEIDTSLLHALEI